MTNHSVRKLAKHFKLKTITIPRDQRVDARYPEPWLSRRMNQKIDTRI